MTTHLYPDNWNVPPSDPQNGWGRIQDAVLFNPYTFGSRQFRESGGCSCKE